MRKLVDNLTESNRVEIEYYFKPVKDEAGNLIDTGKTTQRGPDPEDKEPLYKHKAKVNQISVFIQEGPDTEVFRRLSLSPYVFNQIYLQMKQIEEEESEEPIGDW